MTRLLTDEELFGGAPAPVAAQPPPQPAPQAPATPEPKRLYSDQELWAAPSGAPVPAGPAIVDDLNRGAGFLTTMRASLAPDRQDQIRRFAAARGIPVDRYGVVNDDVVFYDTATGQLVKEVPTIAAGDGAVDTFFRVGQQAASVAGSLLPGAAAGVAGAAAGPTGWSIPAAAGAAAATDVLRQLADRALAGEELSRVDLVNAAGHGAAGAVGQGLALGAGKLFTRNRLGVAPPDRAAATDPANLAAWEDLRQAARAEGVPLTAGELTGLPSLLNKERALRRFPESADRFADVIGARNSGAVPAAFRRQLGDVPPSEIATRRLKEAGEEVIRGAYLTRTNAASPHYEAAFNSGVEPDVSGVVSSLSDRLGQVAQNSPAARAMEKVRKMLVLDVQTVTDPQTGKQIAKPLLETDYRRLHSAKEAIDDMIADIEALGSSAERRALRGLTETQQELTGVLRAAHPEYEAGRQVFIDYSPVIDKLKEGGVGVIANLNGQDRAQLLDAVFSASRIAPGDVEKARKAFVFAGKEAEWTNGLNAWLSDKLAGATAINANGQAGNVPGKLYKTLWGDDRQREILKAALGDPQRLNGMERLMQVLQAAGRSLPEGSQTATDMAGMQALTEGTERGARIIGKLTSPNTLLEGGNALAKAWVELRAPAARRKLAEALLSPEALPELRKLQLLSPTSEKALTITTHLLTGAGVVGAVNAAGGGRDRLPDAAVAASGP
ncbi:MAG TPA: hypothetical protein VD995_04680 [Azospirillum sp.]|nr:hypothetical protein [Azospirillum sp.]